MELDLKHLIRIARRWWWILVLAPMIGGGAAYYGADQQPRMYSADAVLLTNAGVSATNSLTLQASRNLAETYSGWIVSRPVLERAANELQYEGGANALAYHVTAASIPETLFIEVSATSDDPEEAARIANTVADQFVLDVQEQTETQHTQVRSSIDEQMAEIESTIGRIDESITELRANGANLTADESAELQALVSERDNLQTDLDQLVITGRSIDVELAAAQARIVVQSPAVPPNTPYAPDIIRATAIGTVLGFMLAAAAVGLLEYLDDTVRNSEQFARLANAPVLASIARVPSLRRGGSSLFVLEDSKSPSAEAMRLLRANLEFASAPDRLSSLLITSPEAEEGKSTITANLGVVMAQAGLKTVIIDADLRRPSQHNIFGIDNHRGISTLLVTPDPDWRQELIALSIPNLMVIPSGPLPPNPSDLLSLERFHQILASLSEWADVVLIDCPPILVASDALVVSARTRGTLLVCRHGQTRRGTLRRATSLLSHGRARLIGVVPNQTRLDQADQYSQYASSNTGTEAKSGRYYFGKGSVRTAYREVTERSGKAEPTTLRSSN